MNDLATTSPFLTLPMVLQALRGSIGAWHWRGWLALPLAMLLHRRLGEICGRMERLAARYQAGRLRAAGARPDVAARVAAPGDGAGPDKAERIWPRRFGWLVRAASYHAAGFGAQLQLILAHPEMVALLTAAPQAARVLRPVCRMLAVETSLLRPRPIGEVAMPGDEGQPAAAQGVKPRVRKPRPPVDWGRIPLPRGVISAARRQGVFKG